MHLPKSIGRHPLKFGTILALTVLVLAAVFSISMKNGSATQQKLRIACIGDSTTWGTHATRAENATYPDYLAKLGRNILHVGNYGVGAKTLLRQSGRAWSDTGELEHAIAFQPDVVVIMFGVNEIAFHDLMDEFLTDAIWLIDQLKNGIPNLRIFIATPTPFAPWDEKIFENEALRTTIIPVLRQVAEMKNCFMIEVNRDYPPTLDYLPDGLHPNAQGNYLIAQLVLDAINSVINPQECLPQ